MSVSNSKSYYTGSSKVIVNSRRCSWMKNVHTTIDSGDELALNTSLFLLRVMPCRRCLIKATLQHSAIVMQDAWLDSNGQWKDSVFTCCCKVSVLNLGTKFFWMMTFLEYTTFQNHMFYFPCPVYSYVHDYKCCITTTLDDAWYTFHTL